MAETSPTSPVLATALLAHDLGLCVIPARIDGSKRPVGNTWEQWQTERPTIEQIHQWFDNGHAGIGIVCGDISGNLEMLELEGVAVVGGVGFEVTKAANEAGIGHIIERLREGYFERTPSGGVHWLYRVAGDAVPGNTKLARRNATDAELIEKLAAENTHLTHAEVERVVNVVLGRMTQAMSEGGRVELRGFGAFSVRSRPARAGRNPRTGETVDVPA